MPSIQSDVFLAPAPGHGVSCASLAKLAGRVAVAVVGDREVAGRVVDLVLERSRARADKRSSLSASELRVVIAKLTFDTALRLVDPTTITVDRSACAADPRMTALQGLRPVARTIVVLREVEGMGFDEIARIVGASEARVSTELFRARLALRGAFAAQV